MEWGNYTDTESPPVCLDAGLSEVCDDLEGLWGPGWIHGSILTYLHFTIGVLYSTLTQYQGPKSGSPPWL